MRTKEEVERFFDGFEPDPGVVSLGDWGDNAHTLGDQSARSSGYVGVGRKP
jgi:hypothetical protein